MEHRKKTIKFLNSDILQQTEFDGSKKWVVLKNKSEWLIAIFCN